MARVSIRRGLGTATAVALTLGLVACSGADDRPEVDGTIVQPGKPGEESEELDEAPEVEPAEANDADVAFAQMMIPHHAQALEMSELAPDAGGSEQVRTLADRINGAQRPEIVLMAGWLTDRGHEAPTRKQIDSGDIPMAHDHGEGEHGGMEGMATEAQMQALSKARGEEFDALFLQLMIRHHKGAISMTSDVLRDGSDRQISELASGMSSDQGVEIDRMTKLLERIG